MSTLTLQDYQSKSINDLYMAVIVEQLSDEEVKKYLNSLTSSDDDYERIRAIKVWINSNPSLAVNETDFFELIKEAFSSRFEKVTPVILLRDGDTYINVYNDKEIDLSTIELVMLEPFSKYYSENEYTFIKKDEKIVLKMHSIKPFEIFSQKIEHQL